VVELRWLGPVYGWMSARELSHVCSSEHHERGDMQEHYASNEGLTRMHMDHAVTIDGGYMHHKVARWSNSGD